MTVRKTEPVFKTEDGREFTTEKEAGDHDMLLVLRREWEAAMEAYGHLLATRYKTADGQPFSWSRWEYFYVSDGWAGAPAISTLHFSYEIHRSLSFDEHNDDLSFSYFEKLGNSNEWAKREYRIGSLYADRRKADEALVGLMELWLAKRTEEAQKLRKKIFG